MKRPAPEQDDEALAREIVGGIEQEDEEAQDLALAEELVQLTPIREPDLFEKGAIGAARSFAVLARAPETAAKFAEYLGVEEGLIAKHVPYVRELADWGRGIEEAADVAEDPRFAQQDILSQVARGAGSMAPFAVAAPLGAGLGARLLPRALGAPLARTIGSGALSALTGAALTAVPMYEDVLAATKDEDKAWAAAALGLGIGASDAFGVGRILGKLNRASAGTLRKALERVAAEGAEEGLQEWVQTLGESTVTKALSGAEIKWLDELAQAGDAGLVGSILGSTVSGLQQTAAAGVKAVGDARSSRTPDDLAFELKYRRSRFGDPEDAAYMLVDREASRSGFARASRAPAVAPIVEYRRQAAEIASQLPPVPEPGGGGGAAFLGEQPEPPSERGPPGVPAPHPEQAAPAAPLDPDEEVARSILAGTPVEIEKLTPRAIEKAVFERERLAPGAQGPAAGAPGQPGAVEEAVQKPADTAKAPGASPAPEAPLKKPKNLGEKKAADARDVLQRVVAQVLKVKADANTDPLTGLLNKRGYEKVSRRVVEEARKAKQRAFAFFIDEGDLTSLNNLFGQDTGDAVMRGHATEWQKTGRKGDAWSRPGGDEFRAAMMGSAAFNPEAIVARIESSAQDVLEPLGLREPIEGRIFGADAGWAEIDLSNPDIDAAIREAGKTAEKMAKARKFARNPEKVKPPASFYDERGEAARAERARRIAARERRETGGAAPAPSPPAAAATELVAEKKAEAAPAARVPEQVAEATAPKVGAQSRLMGQDVTLAERQELGGMVYEIYNAPKGRAVVRVLDPDSGQASALTSYPTFDKAAEEYTRAVEAEGGSVSGLIRKPAQTQPSETEAAGPAPKAEPEPDGPNIGDKVRLGTVVWIEPVGQRRDKGDPHVEIKQADGTILPRRVWSVVDQRAPVAEAPSPVKPPEPGGVGNSVHQQMREREEARKAEIVDELGEQEVLAFPGSVIPDIKRAWAAIVKRAGYVKAQRATVAGQIPTEDMLELGIRKWQDTFRGVKTTQQAVGGVVNEALDTYLAEELRRGKTKSRLEDLRSAYTTPILAGLRKDGISPEEAGEVLMARHAPERNALIALRQPQTRRAENDIRRAERDFFDTMLHLREREAAAERALDRATRAELEKIARDFEVADREMVESERDFDSIVARSEKRIAELKTERTVAGHEKAIRDAEKQYEKELARIEARVARAGRRLEEVRAQARPAQKALLERIENIREAEPLRARLAKLNELELERQVVLSSLAARGAGSGIPNREAAETMARALSGKRAAGFRRLFERFDAMNKAVRAGWVRDGLKSQEQVDALEAQFQFYAPMRSDLSEEEASLRALGTGRGVDVRGREYKTATGRTTKAEAREVLAYAFTQAETAIIRGEKNRVAQTFLAFLRAHASKLEGFAKIKPPQTKKAVVNGYVRRVFDPTFRLADNVLVVHKNGTEVWIEIDPAYQNVADGLKNMAAQDVNRAIRMLGSYTRYLASIVTRYSPVFPLFNAVRDAAGAFINSHEHGVAFAVRTVRDVPLALAALTGQKLGLGVRGKWTRYAAEYRAEGAPIAFLDLNSWEDQVKRIEKDARREAKRGAAGELARQWRSLLDVVNGANDIVENGVRLSAYVHAREDLGMSPARAASWAKNLTVNFERKGDFGAMVNAAYMFANAGIQSTARVGQAVKHPAVRRLLVAGFLGSMAWDQIMRVIGGKDDDGEDNWDKIPSHIRRHNLVIMYPGVERYVTIPTPFVYDWIQTAAHQLSGYLSDDITPGKAIGETLSAGMEAFDPIGSGKLDFGDPASIARFATPTAGDIIIELATNRDWKGDPIMPDDYGTGKPDSQRYWPYVSSTSKAVTDWLNRATGGDEFEPGMIDVSPETLDHLTALLTGGLGRTLSQIYGASQKVEKGEPLEPRDIPFVSRLLREPSPFTSSSEFHELQDAIRAERDRAQRDKRLLSRELGGLWKEGNQLEQYRQRKRKEIDKLTGKARVVAEDELDRTLQQFNARARKVLLTTEERKP